MQFPQNRGSFSIQCKCFWTLFYYYHIYIFFIFFKATTSFIFHLSFIYLIYYTFYLFIYLLRKDLCFGVFFYKWWPLVCLDFGGRGARSLIFMFYKIFDKSKITCMLRNIYFSLGHRHD